ncbi:MAG: ribonuclease E/G, partial [Hyphomicrobiaceae bacterium]
MAENKMLIDATHPEETRVVVLRDGRVEEFDYESAARKLLRGSIFLAKITRVEPSLQAAFVDYGGNRHGFLAFNEIHPDYYQIPHADRLALLEEEAYARSRDSDDDDDIVETEAEADDGYEAGGDDIADDDPSEIAQAIDEFEPGDDQPDSEPAVGDEAIDFEEAAIDVTQYLPPEPPSSDDRAADSSDSPSTEVSETDSEDQAPAAASEADEATAPEDTSSSIEITELAPSPTAIESENEEEAGDGEATDDEPAAASDPKKPRTIAAASAREDRIVSDTIEPDGESDVSQNDLEDSSQPIEKGDKPEAADGDNTVAEASATTVSDEGEGDDTTVEDQGDSADVIDKPARAPRPRRRRRSARRDETASEPDDSDDGDDLDEVIDDVGDADAMEEVPARRRRRARHYKIQEVIKRRQVVLVQVVKEERGNKGAALTTYLSLAGRYTVLMPNTARGGGISRKITNIQDRKRLKAIAQELDVPEGMGLIIRTAGASRTKQEIKRDFEYLLRLWENVRDLTLQSTAPSLVYEEGDLIKRSIRDLYSKDVEQVLVAGEDAHKEAKSFMRMLMPSHAKNVVRYEEAHPLFA